MAGGRRLATGVPARLTPAQGRRFGLTVGAAFLVLAAFFWWREHEVARNVLAAIGFGLVLLGIVVPGRLGPVYRGWMALALAISKVTTPIFMGLLYFVVLTPAGVLRRRLGAHPLRAARNGDGVWAPHGPSGSMTRQF